MALHRDLTATPFSSAPLTASSGVLSEDDGWGYLLPYPSSVLPEVSPEDGGASLLPNSSWPTPTYLPEASVGPPMFSTGFETTVSMEEAVVAMEVRHIYPVVTLSTHPSFRGSVLQLSP